MIHDSFVLIALRQRVFAQFQRLSLSFHERYTSGRMISRLTSDLDAITELLNEGIDTLITSVLSILITLIGVVLYGIVMALERWLVVKDARLD